MEINYLIDLGLTKREAGAYIALLKLEEAKAGKIAEETNEDRTNIYDSLRSLMKKGLVNYVIKNKKTYYRISPPNKLKSYLSEKSELLKEILPNLNRIYKSYKTKPIIEVYEGKEGIKTILQDILNEEKDFVGFGATDRASEILPEFTKRYIILREKKKIKARQIYTEGGKILKTKMSEFRMIPKEYSNPATTLIYGNNVAIFMWFIDPIMVVLIRSKEAAKAYKNNFEFMWSQAKNKYNAFL
jgi:sugar-specific transcriptional regulator TrmB